MHRMPVNLFAALLCCFWLSGNALAQTKIYVDNQTDLDINVIDWSVSGDKVSKKAWKKGEKLVPPGERKSVLSLKRSGKLNWMDPTPRFVEPDKTVIFHTRITLAKLAEDKAVTLLQKLYGEGDTTKMWYAIDGVGEVKEWELHDKEYTSQWITQDHEIKIVFKAFKDGNKTHVEYVFSKP